MKKEIKVPDIAENVETGTIAAVLVSEGDQVTVDQPLVEIETEKASTDIPSLYDGVVVEVKVQAGDEVSVNQVIMIIETDDEAGKDDDQSESDEPDKKHRDEEKDKQVGKEADTEADKKADKEEEEEDSGKGDEEKKQPASKRSLAEVPAAPSVRRIAREMDVDLTQVEGSGPGGRITADDVKEHAGKKGKEAEKEKPESGRKQTDFSKWGPVTREKVSTIRRITAENV